MGAGTVLLGMSAEELTALAKADEQPAYRGKQLGDGVRNGARSLQDISNVRPLIVMSLMSCSCAGSVDRVWPSTMTWKSMP